MSFTNINDPAGVKALLEQLRSSQAWQDLTASGSIAQAPVTTETEPIKQSEPSSVTRDVEMIDKPIISDRISSLLSQLTTPAPLSSASQPPIPTGLVSTKSDASVLFDRSDASFGSSVVKPGSGSSWAPLALSADLHGPLSPADIKTDPVENSTIASVSISLAPSRKKDLRMMSFQQALPLLGKFADDPEFTAALRQIKTDQDDLERKLFEERQAIIRSQEEKVRVAAHKGRLTGTGITAREAESLASSFSNQLQKFDAERAIPAWDGLVSSQQAALESMGVPTMFTSSEKSDRDRQQRVMQVLENLMSADV